MSRRPLRLTLALLPVVASLGCSGSGSMSAQVSGGTGSLRVHLTDAPIGFSDVQSVNVTVINVIVYPADETSSMPNPAPNGPMILMTHPDTFDLLTLTGGATALLASGEVPAGRYSRIRL